MRYRTICTGDAGSPIVQIYTSVNDAADLQTRDQVFKRAYDAVKAALSGLFGDVHSEYNTFVSPFKEIAAEKVIAMKNKFFSIDNISNTDLTIAAADDGANGLKITVTNPKKILPLRQIILLR